MKVIAAALLVLVAILLIGNSFIDTVTNEENPVVGTTYTVREVRYDSMTPSSTLITTSKEELKITNISLKVFVDESASNSKYIRSKDKTQHSLVLTKEEYDKANISYQEAHKSKLPYIEYAASKDSSR